MLLTHARKQSGSGPDRCGQTPGQTPGQRCRSRGCHWATPRICGTIEPAEPFGLALGEQLHVVPSLGAGHHAAAGHGDDVQQIVPPALRPPGIRQTAEMFHQAGSRAAAHHHYPSQPEPIPCFVPRFYQHPQFRMRLPCLPYLGGPISVVSTQRPCCCCSSEAVISSGLAAGLVCSFTDWSLTVHGRVDSRSIAWIAVVSRQVV